jgi:hypothetical protein
MPASKPLDIVARFRAVTTDFNTRQVEAELSDVDDAFRDSSRAADRWSRDVRDAADDAADGIRKDGRFADVGREVGDEFSENIGEAFRSGDYVGALTETFTSLGPSLGKIGLGIGAAIGVGAAIVANIKAREEEIRQMGRTIFDALQDGYMEQAEKENLLTEAFGTDDLDEAYRLLAKRAKSLGVKSGDLFREITSGGRASTDLDAIEQKYLALNRRVKEEGITPRGPALVELNAWRDYWAQVDKVRESIDSANDALRVQRGLVASMPSPAPGTTYGSPTRRDSDFTTYSGD